MNSAVTQIIVGLVTAIIIAFITAKFFTDTAPGQKVAESAQRELKQLSTNIKR